MTIDEQDINFNGLMKSLNFDSEEFKDYQDVDFDSYTFTQLSHVKLEIESQLNRLFDLLKQKYNADMDTPLVTPDGFPRSDIDVVSIRLIRIRIIRLRNDDKQIIHLLDEKMADEFARRRDETGSSMDIDIEPTREIVYSIPFARVGDVVENGPAFNSGLRTGDEIVLFDNDIHAANNNKLRSLVTRVVPDKEINVDVNRGGERVSLKLIPSNNWEGQGLLGCHLIPM
ncbi:NAS2 Probable 26S proteasome regulatory subunit p27 [Candida maltosa Xu316]|uniref:Probable 26S proteasome regulatory subunit p27 n=1 Tax=Candida maltosa (strain Xu316) TaxID=1245528 RepID=M3IT44_CANMX|nr:hypothetical protein G210_5420 [Candida maltosa Xu316]